VTLEQCPCYDQSAVFCSPECRSVTHAASCDADRIESFARLNPDADLTPDLAKALEQIQSRAKLFVSRETSRVDDEEPPLLDTLDANPSVPTSQPVSPELVSDAERSRRLNDAARAIRELTGERAMSGETRSHLESLLKADAALGPRRSLRIRKKPQ